MFMEALQGHEKVRRRKMHKTGHPTPGSGLLRTILSSVSQGLVASESRVKDDIPLMVY